jgi:predicted dithiol-disulfide oxidoreductase (DUF899 family)
MTNPRIASPEEWRAARLALLTKEKQLNRQRDELAAQRRALPWVRLEKEYTFSGPDGSKTLAGLFDGRSQLIVYHFMFGPDATDACKSCSFWAEQYDAIRVHLRQRDANLVVVSRGPLEKFQPFKKRMGWNFPWYSSAGTSFNRDFRVSFDPEDRIDGKVDYNYQRREFPGSEAPGLSVFAKNDAGEVFHTYSCYSRGLDPLNATYQCSISPPRDATKRVCPGRWRG